jgi:thiol-disulfide isomerase/thioredoxin
MKQSAAKVPSPNMRTHSLPKLPSTGSGISLKDKSSAWRMSISSSLAKLKQRRFWLHLFRDLSVLLIIGFAVASYQQRHMLKDIAPSLNMVTTQDIMVFSSYANEPKAKLVYFFGSWCPVCRFTSPSVHEIAKAHPTVAIALASGTDQQINTFMAHKDYQFDVINDDNGSISETWGVQAVPAFYILDNQNNIVFVTSGASSQWGLRLRLWWANL